MGIVHITCPIFSCATGSVVPVSLLGLRQSLAAFIYCEHCVLARPKQTQEGRVGGHSPRQPNQPRPKSNLLAHYVTSRILN